MENKKLAGLLTGLISFILILAFVELDASNPDVTKVAAIATLMAVLWITEAIPLAATSLLPLILFPLLSVLSGEEIARCVYNSVIFLFLADSLLQLQWKLGDCIDGLR
jgi:hypothetical protein